MQDRIKLPFQFDVQKLQADLQRVEQMGWMEHFVKQNYTGDWSVIPLRGPADAQHPVMMIYSDPACTTYGPTPFLEQGPYFQEVLAQFPCELQAVRLMKLTVRSVIKEQRDHDLDYAQGYVRIHIPVVTNPDVEFYLNNQRVIMNEGECWYLRLSDPHRVSNRGSVDRVHLVIDAVVNDWLRELFEREAVTQSLV